LYRFFEYSHLCKWLTKFKLWSLTMGLACAKLALPAMMLLALCSPPLLVALVTLV